MNSPTSIRLRVPEMDCPSCVAKIEGHLRKQPGILKVEGHAINRTLLVDLDRSATDVGSVRGHVARLGYAAVADGEDGNGEEPGALGTWRSQQARIAYVSVALFVVGLLLGVRTPGPRLFSLLLHDVHVADLFLLASAAVGGWNFFPKGIRAARYLALDMNFLMTVAIMGAVGIGEYTEGAAIAFLFALAELLESYSVDRARASVERLLDLAPDTARIVRDGVEMTLPSSEVRVGDVVLLRPGDKVPVDATVTGGASAVDESTLTGEMIPVAKEPGDAILAGTVNRQGFLEARVERPASQSTLARIVRLVEEAQERKTRTERYVERFARYYTPAVAVTAVLVVGVPTLFLGEAFVPWFTRGLTLLVIACPCALVISTPVAVVSGITAAARNGVLIKGGAFLEALGDIKAVAFDKTGTLTVGHPKVVALHAEPGVDEMEMLACAAAVEVRSEHPVGRAVVDEGRKRGVLDRWTAEGFVTAPGRGARARVGTREVVVGSPAYAGFSHRIPEGLTGGGRTLVAVADETGLMGWIVLEDTVRPGASQVVAALREAGVIHLVMVTGDNPDTARAVAEVVGGLDEVRAALLPEDKVAVVRDLAERFGTVAMLGDGVNDAPALASATVGIAMGAAGSDTALETADVALMGDDLGKMVYARSLSRRARSVIRQNIGVSLLVKGLLVAAVPLGWVSLIGAVLVGDLGVSLAVTVNSLRLGRVRS
ncbi:MAG: cation-translocating P-type ATPase [Gemmatimonadota bacterium]|nr:cation-translocating P-type ATPase [Gemmatimonadota bacterium]MDH5760628.1 cation-translocating P-type ATPase [Gemmatimonadota bacterium]